MLGREELAGWPRTPELRVEFVKRADGGAVLRCVRADGTSTWQRHEGRSALFFSFHDLSHLAVETTLGFRQGFYGLIADGWDIEDTGGKGARGRLPAEAILVEHLVGLLDRERVGGAAPLSAAELAAQLAQLAADGRVVATRTPSDAELDAVRHRTAELHDAWARTPEGGTLVLDFDRR